MATSSSAQECLKKQYTNIMHYFHMISLFDIAIWRDPKRLAWCDTFMAQESASTQLKSAGEPTTLSNNGFNSVPVKSAYDAQHTKCLDINGWHWRREGEPVTLAPSFVVTTISAGSNMIIQQFTTSFLCDTLLMLLYVVIQKNEKHG
jgi:hypothetical protein